MAEEVIEKTVDPAPDVSGENKPDDGKAADNKPDAGKAELEALQKEFKTFKTDSDKRVQDAEQSTKYWYDKAEAKATAAEPAKPEKDEPADDPLDVFDDETKAAVRGFVKQETAGMVSTDEVDKRVVSGVRSQLSQDQLVRDFPDLGDNKSDFFKKTTENYQRLDGVEAGNRLRMAVEQTELGMRRSGDWKDPESDSDRIARIAAQAGGRNGGPSDQAGSDELNEAQKDMASNMGISPEAYVKAAKRVAYSTRG